MTEHWAEQPAACFEFVAMGTRCQLRLCGEHAGQLEAAARRAIDEVLRIETKYSRYRDDSIVSRINAAAGGGPPVQVDVETAGLIAFAADLHAASDGLFDITSGVLRRAWDFASGRLPEPDAVSALLPLVGWHTVHWDGRAIALPQRGMQLDFGGFGKEYAADRAATLLREAGVSGGTVNLGGDVALVGPRPDGEPWRLGVAHPRLADAVIASIPLSSGALTTSGDYERFIDSDGERYCHILDPRTGWPVRYWQSVSVVGPACLAAGALSTVAMLLGAEAPAFLTEQGVGFLTVDAQGRVSHDGA